LGTKKLRVKGQNHGVANNRYNRQQHQA